MKLKSGFFIVMEMNSMSFLDDNDYLTKEIEECKQFISLEQAEYYISSLDYDNAKCYNVIIVDVLYELSKAYK